MLKKITSKAITAFFIFILFTGLIINSAAIDASTNASDYLDYYSATINTGSSSRIIVNFDVNATRYMNLVGASYIVVQVNSNGVWTGIASYFGSTTNGMLAANTYSHTGSITYTGTAGKQYRALVTVYAGNSTGEDSRTITTNTVTAT